MLRIDLSQVITEIARSVTVLELHTQSAEETNATLKLILVVEDDLEFGSFLIQMIQEETPYRVILATSGIEALNIVAHLKCDLFLLDYLLPGMSGLELYDRLHAIAGCQETPAFFLSASTRLPHQEIIRRNLKVLTKLTDLDELILTIRECIEREQA